MINHWVVVTAGHTYGPFRSQAQAAGTPVAKWTTSVVRMMTEADSAALDAQEAYEDAMVDDQVAAPTTRSTS